MENSSLITQNSLLYTVKVQKNTILKVLLLLLCWIRKKMNQLNVIKQPIERELEIFKGLLSSSLVNTNPLLNDVFAHLKQRDGKLMRPMLTLLTASLFGTVNEETLHAAVALELLHTASLIHDDVVDESDERRGQLSINAVFNNKVAVLGGDYLLATCLVEATKTNNPAIIDVITKLGQDLSEGELLQLSNVQTQEFSEKVYFDVIRKKTAALFSACTTAGVLSVHVGHTDYEWAQQFGEHLGISFQIKDDIFDYYDSKEIGKPTGNDMLEGKLTLPVIYVLNNTRDEWVREVALKVRDNTASMDEIGRLIDFTKDNGGIEYATKAMYYFQSKALEMLDSMPDSVYKTSLVSFAEYIVGREK